MKFRPIDRKRIQYNNTQSELLKLKDRLSKRYSEIKKESNELQKQTGTVKQSSSFTS